MSKLRRKQIELTLSSGPTDGVYGTINAPNISNTDILEDALDKVVTIIDALVPPNAPQLTSMSENITGVTGKISFGVSNTVAGYDNHPSLDINGTYTIGGLIQGIIASNVAISGTLADNTATGPGTPSPAYVANAFSPGDSGTLELRLDGNTIHSVDLSVFASGASQNGNGSGFTLSAATSSLFPQGTPFDSFKYRTGTWNVTTAEWASAGYGYKTVQVVHVGGSMTQTFNFIIDNDNTTITASGAVLDNLNMTGTKQLSGVTYHTAGSAEYDVTLENVYPYTYSSSASAISFVGTNCTAASQAIPNLVTDENDDVVISNKAVTVTNSGRLLGSSLSISTSVLRTIPSGSTTNLGPLTQFALLLDNVTATSTDSTEQFNDERYRMHNDIENNLDDITGYASGTGVNDYGWDETQSLVGASATHNDGLMVYNGTLRYPSNTTGTSVTTGNFGGVTNGPGGNPNYSAATGLRVYYRYYYRASQSNFVMNVTATTVTFVSAATTPTANNLNIEILAPSQTQNGSAVTEWKDCVTSYTVDSAIGAYNAGGGANVGNIAGANWGLTIGSKTTANSGNVIVLKITAAAAWTGSIDTINIV